jgi:hypothetical protein
MMAVVNDRPRLKRYIAALQKIRSLAESCVRQLTGWAGSIDKLPFEGRRHLPEKERQSRQAMQFILLAVSPALFVTCPA